MVSAELMSMYKHQQKIIDADPKKCGLFLGTGSGKTRIALMLARGSVLVICPKTQYEDKNWERESTKILLNKDTIFNITTISKETFRRDHASLPRFDTVICDEVHSMLGVTPNIRWRKKEAIPKASQLFEAVEQFLTRTHPDRLYLCTATIMRSPFTVWGAMKILGKIKGTIGDFYEFRNKFYIKLPMPGREVFVPKYTNEAKEALATIVKSIGYVGRLEDFFDVPPQTWRTDYIDLTPTQKTRINALRMEYPDPLVRIGKMHQVENGVLSGDEFKAPEAFQNGKIDRILDYAEEFPRMVIFVKYRAQIEQIVQALKKAGKKVLTLTGDTKDRGSVLKDAAELKECVFIAQHQISAGWELKEYPVMIFASRTNSYVDLDQSIGRIQRADNLKKNLYIKLITKGGPDEAIDKALDQKQDFNEKLYVNHIYNIEYIVDKSVKAVFGWDEKYERK